MSCVTPADLGKPIAAIVERCGAPESVTSSAGESSLRYRLDGHGVEVVFDADQMRARVLQFFTASEQSQSAPAWTLALPFESGMHDIALGTTTLAEAQSALAVDADVTTQYGEAYRSKSHNDVVLAFDGQHVARAAFVGERMALVQSGVIARPLDAAPLELTSPVPRGEVLNTARTGPQAAIFRIDVDATGIVRNVTVVVPSGDDAFDASTQQRLGDLKFHPATLDKRPIPGTCFVQVRH